MASEDNLREDAIKNAKLNGVEMIAAAYRRRDEEEGRDADFDTDQTKGELWIAAADLACTGQDVSFGYSVKFSAADWIDALNKQMRGRPRLEVLAAAGALIAAEIDRLQAA